MMSYALLALCLVSAFCCIGFRVLDKKFWGMIAKFIASLSFLATAVFAYSERQGDVGYFTAVFIGLLFAHGGDIFLGLKELLPAYRKQLIPMGMISFLCTQALFITAFTLQTGFNYVPCVVAACIAAAVIILLFALKLKTPVQMKLLIGVYSFAIAFMVASASHFFRIAGGTGALLAMLGAYLFVISDSCLGCVYFTDSKHNRVLAVIEVATYFAAQSLISISVLFI